MLNEQQCQQGAAEICAYVEAELDSFRQETAAFLLNQAKRSNEVVLAAMERLKGVISDFSNPDPDSEEWGMYPVRSGERFMTCLYRAMEALTSINLANGKGQSTNISVWTGSNVGLIELAYALKASGVIGEGRTTLQVIVEQLERAFKIRAGNHTRIFQEILSRKKGYTVFLDHLKDSLLASIDENENQYRKRLKKDR